MVAFVCRKVSWIMYKDLNMANLLDFYGPMLTDKQRESMNFYYNEDLSLGEISEILKITRQGVRDHIKKGETSLSYYEEKLQLLQRFEKMKVQIEDFSNLAKSVIEYNQKYLFSAEITKQMENVLNMLNELLKNWSD